MLRNTQTIRSGPRHIEVGGARVSLVVDARIGGKPGGGHERGSKASLRPLQIFVLNGDGVLRLNLAQARRLRLAGMLVLALLGPLQFWLARMGRRYA